MTINNSNVSALVKEYIGLIEETDDRSRNTKIDTMSERLMTEADWSPEAAEHLVRLASDYGIFMLRNALALAIASRCEDGQLGF